jgi:hypothetical protein
MTTNFYQYLEAELYREHQRAHGYKIGCYDQGYRIRYEIVQHGVTKTGIDINVVLGVMFLVY